MTVILKYSQSIVLSKTHYVASEVVKETGWIPESWVLSNVAQLIKTKGT